jgi:Putative prokaryotic signal transducing protein
MPDEDWIELLRVHDRMQAEITQRFLEDHEVDVQITGGANSALPTLGLTDVRILVPRDQLERAQSALDATRGGVGVHPFRDAPPESYEAPVATRSSIFAVALAFLVPIGGGHFYARHGAAATIFAVGIFGAFVGAMLGGLPMLMYTSILLVLVDAALAPIAVRRANEGHIPSEAKQRAWAFVAVAFAWFLAPVLNALRH